MDVWTSSDSVAWQSVNIVGQTRKNCIERYRFANEMNWSYERCYNEPQWIVGAGIPGRDPRRSASIFDCDNASCNPDSSRWPLRFDSESVSGYDGYRVWLGLWSHLYVVENLSFVSGPILNIRLQIIPHKDYISSWEFPLPCSILWPWIRTLLHSYAGQVSSRPFITLLIVKFYANSVNTHFPI